MIRILACVATLALVGLAQTPAPRFITGTLNDRLVSAEGRARIELSPSSDRALPGVVDGDRVFRANTPQFRPAGAPGGLAVAFVERRLGGVIFVDANLDGRLTEDERKEHGSAKSRVSSMFGGGGAVEFAVGSSRGGLPVPFWCQVVQEPGDARLYLEFTASFRVEGHAEIGGRRTTVSLPYNVATGAVEIRRGKIGIDANGDGVIDLAGFSGPEVMFVQGERVVMRVGDRNVSFESADFATRSFVLREHPASDFVYVELRTGEPMPDFVYTDLVSGASRRFADFKGRFVLLDFWGTWCGPCVAEIPHLKAAYERFRDRGFEILGVDVEHGATPAQVRAFVRDRAISWTITSPESVKELVEQRLRIMAFPTQILVDRDGLIVNTPPGSLSGAALSSTLESLVTRR
jgi:thiol-disulfide isomerase/thioredoxin